MPTKKEIHVRMQDRRWAVLQAEVGEAVSVHDERAAAVKAARALANQQGAEVIVFGLDGKPLGESTEDS